MNKVVVPSTFGDVLERSSKVVMVKISVAHFTILFLASLTVIHS